MLLECAFKRIARGLPIALSQPELAGDQVDVGVVGIILRGERDFGLGSGIVGVAQCIRRKGDVHSRSRVTATLKMQA